MLLCLCSRQGQQMLSSGMPKRPPMTPREIVPSQNNQMAPTNNEIMHDEIIKYIHSAWHKVNNQKIFPRNFIKGFLCLYF